MHTISINPQALEKKVKKTSKRSKFHNATGSTNSIT